MLAPARLPIAARERTPPRARLCRTVTAHRGSAHRALQELAEAEALREQARPPRTPPSARPSAVLASAAPSDRLPSLSVFLLSVLPLQPCVCQHVASEITLSVSRAAAKCTVQWLVWNVGVRLIRVARIHTIKNPGSRNLGTPRGLGKLTPQTPASARVGSPNLPVLPLRPGVARGSGPRGGAS